LKAVVVFSENGVAGGCGGRGGGSTVILDEYVGELDSVGRHGDGFSAHKKF
jgi:hypothetical protein